MLPTKMPVEYTIESTNYRVRGITEDGIIYGHDLINANSLYKRTVTNADWEMVYTFGASIQQVVKTKVGNIIVTLYNAEIYLSKDDGATFSKVFDMPQGHPYRDFGMDIYDSVILLATYGFPTNAEIYLSIDDGETWQTIKQFASGYTHVHDVKYDPYEHLIWACVGDSGVNDRIFWSDDFGRNWQTSDQLMRITQIIPLPDCVLFVSDEYEEQVIYRYNRPERGTWGTKVEPEKVFYPKKDFPGEFMTWGTRAAITYGQDAKALFGFRQNPDNARVPSIVWGTDGEKIIPYWTEPKIASGTTVESVGVMGVWGPDKNGTYVADVITDLNNSEYHLLILKP